MSLLPAQTAAMAAAHAPDLALVIRFATPEPRGIWTGPGPFAMPADDPLAPGEVFTGGGIIRNLPRFRNQSDGGAERLQFIFAAGHPFVRDLITLGVLFKAVNVGLVFLDADYQVAAPVGWIWPGEVDGIRKVTTAADETRVISATGGACDRQMAGNVRWTPASHEERNPGDFMCERVDFLTPWDARVWP